MVARGDGKFGPEADPKIPPNQTKYILVQLIFNDENLPQSLHNAHPHPARCRASRERPWPGTSGKTGHPGQTRARTISSVPWIQPRYRETGWSWPCTRTGSRPSTWADRPSRAGHPGRRPPAVRSFS